MNKTDQIAKWQAEIALLKQVVASHRKEEQAQTKQLMTSPPDRVALKYPAIQTHQNAALEAATRIEELEENIRSAEEEI